MHKAIAIDDGGPAGLAKALSKLDAHVTRAAGERGLASAPNGEPSPDKQKKAANGSRAPGFKRLTDLRAKEFPELAYVVPGIIAEGCTLLAGRPKIGKSWMALDIALAVANGQKCLGTKQCEKGDVLYLALEDGERRFQRRVDKLLSPFAAEWPELRYATIEDSVERGDKALAEIGAWAKGVGTPRLVVVDVLARVRAPSPGGKATYESDYAAVRAFTDLAARFPGLAIIIVCHTRKGVSETPLEQISGTLGLSGAADGYLVLDRTGQGATLTGEGRDVENVELAVQFDKPRCRWMILGNAEEVQRSNESATVIAVLTKAGKALATRDILAATPYRRDALDKLLSRMVVRGEIERVGRGQYALVSDIPNPLSEVSEVRNMREMAGL